MKAFFVVALAIAAAVAEPESDPELVYTDGTFHTNLRNLHKGVHTPYTAGRVGGIYNSVKVPTAFYPTTTGFYSSPYHGIFKREAESDADSLVYLNQGIYNPYRSVAYPQVYSPYSSLYAGSAIRTPYHGIFKREAESDADSLVYLNQGIYNPYRSVAYPQMYSPYSSLYAGSAIRTPYHGIFKRDAESDADSLVYLNSGLARPVISSTYPYTTTHFNTAYTRPVVTPFAGYTGINGWY